MENHWWSSAMRTWLDAWTRLTTSCALGRHRCKPFNTEDRGNPTNEAKKTNLYTKRNNNRNIISAILCLLIDILILFLQWKEKRKERERKKQWNKSHCHWMVVWNLLLVLNIELWIPKKIFILFVSLIIFSFVIDFLFIVENFTRVGNVSDRYWKDYYKVI